jgi:hypothetical protein
MSDLSQKIDELLKTIMEENGRLQIYKYELEKILDHMTNILPSLSKIYKQKKDEVSSRGEEWHKLIDKTVKSLHQELDDMLKKHESLLQQQKRELEKILEEIDEMNNTTITLKKFRIVMELDDFIPMIEKQESPDEIILYSFPVFQKGKVDDSYLKSYFGYIANIQERKISLRRSLSEDASILNSEILELPSVSVINTIDSGFPASEKHEDRLYAIVAVDDERVWMGGESEELKLFDFYGILYDTVPITTQGMYLTVHNKHVVYTAPGSNIVCRVGENKGIEAMFTTAEWKPYGITSTASDDLLVCLRNGDQSKVVQYSSTGTVLQEIQYDSQGQPLYEDATYIAENVNGDIIVTDWKKKVVTAVTRSGIFRFLYSGKNKPFFACAVTTDSIGHVIVTDFLDKIHVLDRDGRFLRFIIPDQGIKFPRSVCIVRDGEMLVGESRTGLAKIIKYLGPVSQKGVIFRRKLVLRPNLRQNLGQSKSRFTKGRSSRSNSKS